MPFGTPHRCAHWLSELTTGARPAYLESPTGARPKGPQKTMDELRSSARTCPASTTNAGHARGALLLGRNAQLQHGPPDCSPLGNRKSTFRRGKTLMFGELRSSARTRGASRPHAWHAGSAHFLWRKAHSPRGTRLAAAQKLTIPFSLLWKELKDQARPMWKDP